MGCRPLAPERLAYPEWFDAEFLYSTSPSRPEREAGLIADALIDHFYPAGLSDSHQHSAMAASHWRYLSWEQLGPLYRDQLT